LRVLQPGYQLPSGFGKAVRDSVGSRRKYTRQWMDAWMAIFGKDFAGYSVGLDAWFPMRDTMPAAEFIRHYVPRGALP
jgi:hypothetical protein